MALAVLVGSRGSGGGGAREVFTEQNRHPRVHWSPKIFRTDRQCHTIAYMYVHGHVVSFGHRVSMLFPSVNSLQYVIGTGLGMRPPLTMMVAVAVRFSPPPQHSPILGHFASSHTCRSSH